MKEARYKSDSMYIKTKQNLTLKLEVRKVVTFGKEEGKKMEVAIVKGPKDVVGLLPILYLLTCLVTTQMLTCDHSLSYIFMFCANDLNGCYTLQ